MNDKTSRRGSISILRITNRSTTSRHCFRMAPPSLIDCASLHVKGPVRFESAILIEGEVTIINRSSEPRTLSPGTYADDTVEL